MRNWRASWPVALEGTLHGALSLWLWRDGHTPSFGSIGPHYLVQGLALPFLMPLLWWVAVRVVSAQVGNRPRLDVALAWAMAAPTAVLLVGVDAVAYATGGMERLTAVVRISAPILLVTLLLVAGRAVQTVCADLPPARAALAGWSGLLVALALGALVVR